MKTEVAYVDWVTVKDIAIIWEITTRRAQYLCANGKVKGAQKLGDIWVVPKGTKKPIDGRTRAAKKRINAEETAPKSFQNRR